MSDNNWTKLAEIQTGFLFESFLVHRIHMSGIMDSSDPSSGEKMANSPTTADRGMWTDLAGRLERLEFAAGAHMYLPIFEAIHNALDAIDESNVNKGEITVTIEREEVQQLSISEERRPPAVIKDIIIVDNGKGFDAANLKSFQTLDSQLKLKRGGKGVGRLIWLKAFESAEIESVFEEGGEKWQRTISFSAKKGCVPAPPVKVSKNTLPGTKVRLQNYKRLYESCLRTRKPNTVANDIGRQFLPYLLFGKKDCVITVVDGEARIPVSKEGLPKPDSDKFVVAGEEFEIHHLRMTSGAEGHLLSECASGRVVQDIKLLDLDIPVGKKGKIKRQDDTEFHYVGYITSKYFDKKVTTDRTGFNIEPTKIVIDGLEMVSEPAIRERAREFIESFLKDDLEGLRKSKDTRIDEVLDERLSAFKYLKKFNAKDLEQIPLDDTKDEIADRLISLHYKNHVTVAQEAKDVLRRVNIQDPQKLDFEKELKKFSDVLEVHQADLGQYVVYRAWILDLLLEICSKRSDGKYELEKALHSLIFPMRTDEWKGAGLAGNKHNLWLIDERFAMFDYITSDLELTKHQVLEGITEETRPDLCCYFFGENRDQVPVTDVAIIELKRPGKEKPYSGEEDGDPIQQVLGYVEQLLEKRMKDKAGRPINVAKQTKFFCYVICDIENDYIERLAKLHRMKPSFDQAGWYDYWSDQNAYVEVISLNKLLSHARMRNKLFFEKLGLPTKGRLAEAVPVTQ